MGSTARILVVEDDPALRTTLTEVLADAGYDVASATDGKDALAQLGGRAPPSIILLDLAMPVMDGWAFREAQKRDPRIASIPTVILSGSLSEPGALDGLGADAALAKPFELARLIETLKRFCVA
jgi:CheY-like chemotaxis protein